MAENLCPARAEGGRLAVDPRDHPCRITGLPGHIGGHSQSQGCLRSDETAKRTDAKLLCVIAKARYV